MIRAGCFAKGRPDTFYNFNLCFNFGALVQLALSHLGSSQPHDAVKPGCICYTPLRHLKAIRTPKLALQSREARDG